MTGDQVEAMMGPPIRKIEWSADGTRNWMYTEQAAATSDYWRRWIFIKDGKVVVVIQDYWWD